MNKNSKSTFTWQSNGRPFWEFAKQLRQGIVYEWVFLINLICFVNTWGVLKINEQFYFNTFRFTWIFIFIFVDFKSKVSNTYKNWRIWNIDTYDKRYSQSKYGKDIQCQFCRNQTVILAEINCSVLGRFWALDTLTNSFEFWEMF